MTLLTEALALRTGSGDGGMVSSLESMAGLAAQGGGGTTAARLFGAAQALREASGSLRPPHEIACYEADLARLRSVLDPKELEDAWARGGGDAARGRRGAGPAGTAAWDWPSRLGRPHSGRARGRRPGRRRAHEPGDRRRAEHLVRHREGRLTSVYSKIGVTSRHKLRAVNASDRPATRRPNQQGHRGR